MKKISIPHNSIDEFIENKIFNYKKEEFSRSKTERKIRNILNNIDNYKKELDRLISLKEELKEGLDLTIEDLAPKQEAEQKKIDELIEKSEKQVGGVKTVYVNPLSLLAATDDEYEKLEISIEIRVEDVQSRKTENIEISFLADANPNLRSVEIKTSQFDVLRGMVPSFQIDEIVQYVDRFYSDERNWV